MRFLLQSDARAGFACHFRLPLPPISVLINARTYSIIVIYPHLTLNRLKRWLQGRIWIVLPLRRSLPFSPSLFFQSWYSSILAPFQVSSSTHLSR